MRRVKATKPCAGARAAAASRVPPAASRMRRPIACSSLPPHLAARAVRLELRMSALRGACAGSRRPRIRRARPVSRYRRRPRCRALANRPSAGGQGSAARRVSSTWRGWSPTGETNKSIAHRLHISEHTVEHHLSSIFARLGIRSRSQLAARIGERCADSGNPGYPRTRDSV